MITYAYDGLLRLTEAVENPGTAFTYAYDLAGNRTDAWQNGILVAHHDYDAANQVVGWAYDEAGNLKSDGLSLYTYDALNRMTTRGTTYYSYNGDGVLVSDGSRRYTQDLAAPLSQVLQTTQDGATTNYLYGLSRVAAVDGTTRTWHQGDALPHGSAGESSRPDPRPVAHRPAGRRWCRHRRERDPSSAHARG